MKPTATTLYPFVPSGADFELALRFFTELGFTVQWNADDLAGLRFGGAYFMLQKFESTEWQENQMITVEVNDLEAYAATIAALDLPARFPTTGTETPTPKDYPWGREMHLRDPAGVCWHFRQSEAVKPLLWAVAPQFVVSDLMATADYYRDVLGFEIAGTFLDPPVHAIVSRGRAEIFLAKASGPAGVSNRTLKPVAIDAYIRLVNLDQYLAEIQSRGARVIEGPVTRAYGIREIVVEDCNGFVLVFGEAVD